MTAPSQHDERRTVASVAIVGNDAMLAAAPATPVQLAHACLRRGFTVAIPTSWGDEIVAAETVRQLGARSRGPAVMCVCPYVRARLLAPGPDLAPFLVSLVAPPIAAARYVRALYADRGVHITYIGGCPSGDDPAIDAHLTPDTFFADLAEHGISLGEQPLVFDSIVPPDRRRWHSLPGGVPSAEILWGETDGRALVEIEPDDISTGLAQHIIAHEHALLDLAPGLGCACSGAIATIPSRSARVAVVALEPPRALGPVVDPAVPVTIEAPLVAPVARQPHSRRNGTAAPESRVSESFRASSYREHTVTEQGAGERATIASTRIERSVTIEATAEIALETEDESDAATRVETDAAEAAPHDTPVARPVAIDEKPQPASSANETTDESSYVAEASPVTPGEQEPPSPPAEPAARRRTLASVAMRHTPTSVPRTITPVGRTLPRAYVAKRKTPPSQNVHAASPGDPAPLDARTAHAPGDDPRAPLAVDGAMPHVGPGEHSGHEGVAAGVLEPGVPRQPSSAAERAPGTSPLPAPALTWSSPAPAPSPSAAARARSARPSIEAQPRPRPETTTGEARGWVLFVVVAALVALGALVVTTLR